VACLNSDGTLTRSAREVLGALREPADEREIAARSSVPLFKVRGLLRDMTGSGLVVPSDGVYRLTEDGADLLQTVN